jgi:hypothetical protein
MRERERERRKKKNRGEEGVGATSSVSSGWVLLIV